MKHRGPVKDTAETEGTIVPTKDTDEELVWVDVQGETPYSDPPDPNMITIDHEMDEEHIWNFMHTGYNQSRVSNGFAKSAWDMARKTHVPGWAVKQGLPSFVKDGRSEKIFRHWNHRLGLEKIKLLHVLTGENLKPETRQRRTKEISDYLE